MLRVIWWQCVTDENRQDKDHAMLGNGHICIIHTHRPPKTDLHLIVVGVNSQEGECLVRLFHQGWMPLAKELPRVLHEVDRLKSNLEKLFNTGGRCWNDTLGRKRSFRTHQPPYPTRRGLVTDWQETKKLSHEENWLDIVREDLKEIKSKTTRIRKQPKTKKEIWRSFVRASSSKERKEEDMPSFAHCPGT